MRYSVFKEPPSPSAGAKKACHQTAGRQPKYNFQRACQAKNCTFFFIFSNIFYGLPTASTIKNIEIFNRIVKVFLNSRLPPYPYRLNVLHLNKVPPSPITTVLKTVCRAGNCKISARLFGGRRSPPSSTSSSIRND